MEFSSIASQKTERKRIWIAAVYSKAWKACAFLCVCSDHFVNGEKSNDPMYSFRLRFVFVCIRSQPSEMKRST